MTTYWRLLFSVTLLLIVVSSSISQNWQFSHLSNEQGLSTGTVNCVFKDSKGFVWIGTIDGLNRYNGYDITVFKADKNDSTSLSGNVVTSIAEDSRGNIWIGTRNNGINIFNWENETFKPLLSSSLPSLATTSVQKIVIANSNEILIGLQGEGLCHYNLKDGTLKIYRADPSNPSALTNDNIFSIIPSDKDHFWIGNHHGGVDLFDIRSKTFKRYTYDINLDPNETMRQTLHQDKNGLLWIGTDGEGLIRFDTKNLSYRQFQQGVGSLNTNIVKCLYQDENGLIYIGTDGGGINILNTANNTFSYLQSDLYNDKSLSSNAIYDIYEDKSGLIWVSTFRGGVNIFSKYGAKFHLYEQLPGISNSLSFNSVIAIEESRDGYIWIGTDGGGLDRLDPRNGTFRHFTNSKNPTSISSNVAISILEDVDGMIWAGTYAGGVNRYNPSTNQFKRFQPDPDDPKSINSRNVWAIVEDQQNELWFGLLDGGIAHFNKSEESFEHFDAFMEKNALSSNLVISLLNDSQDQLWVGTEDEGLNLFDKKNKSFTEFKNDPTNINSLLSNSVRTLYEDRNGTLWVGTAEGMNEMNIKTKELSVSKVNVLLPNLVINGILEDQESNLWISTNQGISKYDPKEHTIQNFSISDGLQGNEFNYTASLKTKDGRMYFGGIHGLNDFHPREVSLSPLMPEIVITSIQIFDQPVTEMVTKDGKPLINTSLQYLEELTLRHDQNVLEINFSSLDYTSPSSNSYRYQLEGFDQSWVYVDANKRSANYTNLDPGTYAFKVNGSNSDGVWSTHERILTLNVLPPWWETWWFRFLVMVILVSATLSIYRWRAAMVKQQKRDLELRVEEATKQVVQQNTMLQAEKENLTGTIADINYVINEAVESGNFSARIDTESKEGQWKELGESVNQLFDSIINPFNAINAIVNEMAQSNLSKRFEDEAKGELKEITNNLNHALDNLSELLFEIIRNTKSIGTSSNEMMVSSEEMNVSTNEIASSIAEMSQGAQNQVNRIDEASQILENILNASSDVTNQAESINDAAEEGVSLSDNGKLLIGKMEMIMEKMERVSVETNKSITILSNRSSEISRVLNIIKDISEQTNMLALNAAIEAAKAGDSGRGFSVVAEQIRKLAEDSGQSTSVIERMIEEIQESIDSTTKLISEMGNDIKEGVNSSDKASESFGKLAQSYATTLELSKHILSSTKSQNLSVKQVVELIESVVVIAEETAAGTEQAASSSQELSTGMTEFANKTKEVSEIVGLLEKMVGQFTLRVQPEAQSNDSDNESN